MIHCIAMSLDAEVSVDSAMRAHVSIGLPIDPVVHEANALTVRLQRRVAESAPYRMIDSPSEESADRVFSGLPHPEP
ncbi:MAG TPA: hypothetical protein VL742_00640 [Casimicrobiaceae bacterium]|nr:hypothetical protein [Casimicrobiaceae bacterium]